MIAAIVHVVPASRWLFARVGSDGMLAGGFGAHVPPGEIADLQSELERQRQRAKSGPRIAAALAPPIQGESAVTLLFADARATFGILTLVRDVELGPFTSSEISMLTLALAATTDQLAMLAMPSIEHDLAVALPMPAGVMEPDDGPEAASYVLDREMKIVLAFAAEDQLRMALTGVRTRVADRLPTVIEDTVRDLTAAWRVDAQTRSPGSARPVPFLVVRTQPMTGPAGQFIGVRIDRFRAPNSLGGVAARFHISPRELQVLALLLDGAHLDEIAKRLNITSSTVQDHIRNMVEKTRSRNRTALIARVLGWEFAPAASTL